ncbi:hypothetical protein FRC07_004279, partial [Ceratobasidium sp. 392]
MVQIQVITEGAACQPYHIELSDFQPCTVRRLIEMVAPKLSAQGVAYVLFNPGQGGNAILVSKVEDNVHQLEGLEDWVSLPSLNTANLTVSMHPSGTTTLLTVPPSAPTSQTLSSGKKQKFKEEQVQEPIKIWSDHEDGAQTVTSTLATIPMREKFDSQAKGQRHRAKSRGGTDRGSAARLSNIQGKKPKEALLTVRDAGVAGLLS